MGNAVQAHTDAVLQRRLRRKQLEGEQLVFENKETMQRLYESHPVVISGVMLPSSTTIMNPFGNVKVDEFEAKYIHYVSRHKDDIFNIERRMAEVRARYSDGSAPTEDDLEKIASLQEDLDAERAALAGGHKVHRKLKRDRHVHELAALAQASQTARSQIAVTAKKDKKRLDKVVQHEDELDDLVADSRDLIQEVMDSSTTVQSSDNSLNESMREKALQYLKAPTQMAAVTAAAVSPVKKVRESTHTSIAHSIAVDSKAITVPKTLAVASDRTDSSTSAIADVGAAVPEVSIQVDV